MLTWILLAIIVAALLGYINVDKVRAKLIEYYNKYLPFAFLQQKQVNKYSILIFYMIYWK